MLKSDEALSQAPVRQAWSHVAHGLSPLPSQHTDVLEKTKPNNKFLHARCLVRINVTDHFVAQTAFVVCGRFDFHEINRSAIGSGRASERSWAKISMYELGDAPGSGSSA